MMTVASIKMKSLVKAVIICACVLAAMSAFAVAFLVSDDCAVNVFTPGENTSHIEEDFGDYEAFHKGEDYTKKVAVKNDGNVPCYVRMFAEIEDPYTDESAEVDLNTVSWSHKCDDGFFYYNKAIEPGESTEPLFTMIKAKEDIADFKMICYSETVQSEGFDSPQAAFGSFKGAKK